MNILENYGVPLYFISMFLLYFSYFLIFFGIFKINTTYINYLTVYVHIFVSLFLIIRFNPFVKQILKPYDGNIIFGSAILLLFNVVLNEKGINNASPLEFINKYIHIKKNEYIV